MHGDFARKLSPSEEALAHYIIKHPRLFKGKRVLDVGAGLGFAGLVCAACTQAESLELTDGDPEVISTLSASIQLNAKSFGETKVGIKKVLWDRCEEWYDRASFDVVIAADVVYLEHLHSALLGMVARVLRPGCLFLLFASRRNGSLEHFVAAARNFFPTVEASTDYDEDVARAIGKGAKCFPVMVRLSAAEETTESDLPQSVVKMCEEMRKRQDLEQRRVRAEERSKQREHAKHLAARQALLQSRQRRLEASEAEEEEEQHIAAAAAAAAAVAAAAAKTKPREPTVSHMEQEGLSDWGLFSRQCVMSSDGLSKHMTYDIGGRNVSIRRAMGGSGRISPSEEALAMWIFKHRRQFKRRRVLELGAGAGLAGLVAGLWTSAKCVELTDGDPQAVAALEENRQLNQCVFTAKKVCSQRLSFGEIPEGTKPFDWILAGDIMADCDPAGLVNTLRRLMKPSGIALFFTSPQGTSLNNFLMAAGSVFERVDVQRHYDEDVERAFQGMNCFPHMVRLRRSTLQATGKPRARPVSAPAPPAPAATACPAAPKPPPLPTGTRAVQKAGASRAPSALDKCSADMQVDERGHGIKPQRQCRRPNSQGSRRIRAASCGPVCDATVVSGADVEVAEATTTRVVSGSISPAAGSEDGIRRLPSISSSRGGSPASMLAAAEASAMTLCGRQAVDTDLKRARILLEQTEKPRDQVVAAPSSERGIAETYKAALRHGPMSRSSSEPSFDSQDEAKPCPLEVSVNSGLIKPLVPCLRVFPISCGGALKPSFRHGLRGASRQYAKCV
jgi:predicted nicotinamide N-methyase